MRNKFIRIMAGVLSAFMILSQFSAVAEESASVNTESSAESVEQSKETTPQIAESKFTLSDELKATVLNLGDFAAEKFSENFSKKLDTLIGYGMNGIYINPYGKDGTYYSKNMNKSDDRLEKALEAATLRARTVTIIL